MATTTMPNLVTALVLFYGGKLVLSDDGMTSGKLVSFLLYLSSLSDAINNMGSILSGFTQALGAADKGTWLAPIPDSALRAPVTAIPCL